MANSNIAGLPAGAAITNTDLIAGSDAGSGTLVKKTGAQLRTWAQTASLDPLNLAQYNGVVDCTAALQAALDDCFGTALAPHGASAELNKEFILPPGVFNITSALTVTNVRGGVIRGAGRLTTLIHNTAGGDVFRTNGFEYSRVSGMLLTAAGTTGTLFDLDWTNTGTALQSNTFSDMYFASSGIGVRIGNSGFMGSENLFLNCFFDSNAIAGLKTCNFNALQNTVVGGDFQFCSKGIWVSAGSVPGIYSVGFQNGNGGYDIVIDSAAFNDPYTISGCRTESVNFLNANGGSPVIFVSACNQVSATAGDFAVGGAFLSLYGCQSLNGRVTLNTYFILTVEGSYFQRSDWNQHAGPYRIDGLSLLLNRSSNFTLDGRFIVNETTIVGTGASAPWSLTVPSDANLFTATSRTIPIGTRINVLQKDANQITVAPDTGVTLHTARSLTTRAQYSAISLTKIAVDEWIVSGDLT